MGEVTFRDNFNKIHMYILYRHTHTHTHIYPVFKHNSILKHRYACGVLWFLQKFNVVKILTY